MIFQLRGIENVTKNINALPRQIRSSQKSALGSVGFFLKKELEKQIKTGGAHASGKWKKLHPLTRLPKQRFGKRQRLTLRRRTPLQGLRKFTRYRASNDAVQVLFARSRKGRVGSFDKLMNEFVARSEFGETQTLSRKSKRFRAARGFPVRKATSKIRIPARQVVNPVFRKNKRQLPILYRQKFEASLQRKIDA